MGNTTKFRGKASGTTGLAALVYGKSGGTTLPAKYIYVKNAGTVTGVYSVLNCTASNATGSNSGNASSGSVTSSSNPNIGTSGNIGSLSYLWSQTGGPAGTTCNATGSANPSFTGSPSGAAPGNGSQTLSTTWQCVVTDTVTGASFTVTGVIVSLTWTNTTPAYTNMSLSVVSNVGGYCEVGFAPGSCISSASIQLQVNGGNGSYSVSWSPLVADPSGITKGPQNNLSTYVSKSLFCGSAGPGESVSGQWRCTVHDGIGPDAHYDWSWGCDSFAANGT